MIQRFKKLQFDKELSIDEITRLQSNVDAVIGTLPDLPILNGQLLKNVQLSSATPNSIPHKLGRKFLGYFVIRKSAESDVWDTENPLLQDKYILLNCSADVTISLWVF